MDPQRLASALAEGPLAVLDEQALGVLAAAPRRHLADGEVLLRAGERSPEAYVLVEGALEVLTADGTVVGTLERGSLVGELAALRGAPRSATVRASGEAMLLEVDEARFAAVLAAAPGLAERLADDARLRLGRTRLSEQLAALLPLDEAATAEVVAEARWRALGGGEVLVRQGEPADAAFVVVLGRLRVIDEEAAGGPRPLADVGAGDLVGERALLEDARRGASVVAARDSLVAELPRGRFEDLVHRAPGALLPVVRRLLDRASQPVAGVPTRGGSLALVPLGGADVGELAAALTARCERHGPAERLDSARVDAELGGVAQAEPGDADDLRLSHWLTEVEAANDVVVLEGDAEATAWTRRCARQADQLVLVADAAGPADVDDVERRLLAERRLPHQRVALVLVHPPGQPRATGSGAWLEPRSVDLHLHVRRGDAADLDRLARHLAGRPLGLVLSGGGARGFAHIGVVRALEEHGVAVDAVAGTSSGAMIGALLALPSSAEELLARTRRAFPGTMDYTLPLAGLVKGKRVAEAIAAGLEGRDDLADLWLPYLAVSTNLTRATAVEHRRGDGLRALRATSAVPGVMPPVPEGDDLLVDGGLLDNLPIERLRRHHPTARVLAVDVAPPRGPSAKEDFGTSLSGAGLLARRATPGVRAPKVPGLGATLMRSMLVGAVAERDRTVAAGRADCYLPLDLRGVGLLEFDGVDAVAERGYEAARERVAAWVAEEGLARAG